MFVLTISLPAGSGPFTTVFYDTFSRVCWQIADKRKNKFGRKGLMNIVSKLSLSLALAFMLGLGVQMIGYADEATTDDSAKQEAPADGAAKKEVKKEKKSTKIKKEKKESAKAKKGGKCHKKHSKKKCDKVTEAAPPSAPAADAGAAAPEAPAK
jgi:hypothetical protein